MEIELALRVVDTLISGLALLLSLVTLGLVLGMKWSRQSVQLVPFDPEQAARDDKPRYSGTLNDPILDEPEPSEQMKQDISELSRAMFGSDVNESYNDDIL